MVKTPFHQESLPIPPLESGDRLNRYEFERRYKAMPSLKKAELIEADNFEDGVICIAWELLSVKGLEKAES